MRVEFFDVSSHVLDVVMHMFEFCFHVIHKFFRLCQPFTSFLYLIV
ncbi:hypothetical protein J2129_001249 [Methanofollis sp. W23]|nr:hypothetical protein [Methanofollis sp. W23]